MLVSHFFHHLNLIYQVEAWEGLTGFSLKGVSGCVCHVHGSISLLDNLSLSRKGLSSSAAICVLIVRSLNKLYVPRQIVRSFRQREAKLEQLKAQLAQQKLDATRFRRIERPCNHESCVLANVV